MSKLRAFTEESRDDIIKSATNQSTSKQAWSFSKTKRFAMPIPNCPYVSYNTNQSTFSNRKTGFGSSRRRVFTQVNEGPSPWVYQPSDFHRTTTISFAGGRDEVVAGNYIAREPIKNPGPGRYENTNATTARLAYTMRPRTANHRNYFIEDKEAIAVPGPGAYDDQTSQMTSKNVVSKFKSAVLGSCMSSKTKRFPSYSTKTPSVWDYNKGNNVNLIGKNPGSRIGSENRQAFTQKAARSSFTPGPGNYKLPTQFAHYRRLGQQR